jgi:hypothetical protein
VLPTRAPGKTVTIKRVIAAVVAAPVVVVLLVGAVHWWRTNEGPADKLRNGIVTELAALKSGPPFAMDLPVTDNTVELTSRCEESWFDGEGEPTISRTFSFDPAARDEIVRRIEGALAQDGWNAETDPAGYWIKSSGPYELRASYGLSDGRGSLFAEVPSHQYCRY